MKSIILTVLFIASQMSVIAADSSAERLNPTGPFSGKINNALTMAKSRVVYIVPTQEVDKTTQQAIQDYVHRIRDRLGPGAPLITDEEALNRNLSNNIVVAYGTLTGNRWLAQKNVLPALKIESATITAGMVFAGEHLRFITTCPNPDNPDNALVIYTAQRAEDIVQINSVFHGPTDYVVADGTKILKAADYNKHNGIWTFPVDAEDGTQNKLSPAERLKQVKSLYEQGLIGKEDYDKKVKEIMELL